MSVRYSNKIVTDGLIFYLDAANPKSYTTGSLIWKDLIGGLECKPYYAHRISPGFTTFPYFSREAGGCMQFTVADDSGLNATASLSFPNTAITMETWCRRDSTSTGFAHPRIIELWDNLTNSSKDTFDGHALNYEPDGSLRAWVNQGPSTSTTNRSNTHDTVSSYLDLGMWYHWVFTFDTVDDQHLMYINGVQVYNYTQNMLAVRDIDNITIGNIGPWFNYSENGDCTIALCRVYDKALSVDEIQQNFNAGRGRFGV